LFRRRYFFQGSPNYGGEIKDIVWLNSDGSETRDDDWNQASSHCLGLYFAGGKLIETDGRGRRLKDNNLLLLLNAYHEEIAFMLPQFEDHEYWEVLLDTRDAIGTPDVTRYKAEQAYPLGGRSLVLLKQA
jgi:glycogen operon protein